MVRRKRLPGQCITLGTNVKPLFIEATTGYGAVLYNGVARVTIQNIDDTNTVEIGTTDKDKAAPSSGSMGKIPPLQAVQFDWPVSDLKTLYMRAGGSYKVYIWQETAATT